jgi:hypothetical protein
MVSGLDGARVGTRVGGTVGTAVGGGGVGVAVGAGGVGRSVGLGATGLGTTGATGLEVGFAVTAEGNDMPAAV